MFKEKLKNQNLICGSWITTNSPQIADLMAGFDFEFLTIDMEHTVIELETMVEMIRAIQLSSKKALVRVGEHNPNLIKRVMDAGADGIIVAMVNSREEAEKVVQSVKYPPKGKRGVGLSRAQKYGFGFEAYKKWLEVESIVIVQIEHIDAIENLEEILGVDGIDGTMIGPYDLSGSLGIPGEFDNSQLLNTIAKYEEVCKNMRKPMGFHIVHPDQNKIAEYINRGYSFLPIGTDTIFLGEKIQETLQRVRSIV